MSILKDLTDAIRDSSVELIDLTAPLTPDTPIIQLPPPFGNTARFALSEISRYDDRGPAWYWNDITTGEHTGTHFDAPVHWASGRDGEDISQVPVTRLIAPAAVLDFSEQAAADPDFLLEIDHVKEWEAANGPLPDGGWLLYRTGWDARSHDQAAFLNANESGPHTPGISVSCAAWLAQEGCASGNPRRPGRHRLGRPAAPGQLRRDPQRGHARGAGLAPGQLLAAHTGRRSRLRFPQGATRIRSQGMARRRFCDDDARQAAVSGAPPRRRWLAS